MPAIPRRPAGMGAQNILFWAPTAARCGSERGFDEMSIRRARSPGGTVADWQRLLAARPVIVMGVRRVDAP